MRIIIFALFAAMSAFGAAKAETWNKLVTPAELADMQTGAAADTGVVAGSAPLIIDIRSADAYAEGHIEGAVNAPYGLWRGPQDNPGRRLSDAALTSVLRQTGVTRSRPVLITYRGESASDFGAAARVYWTLKSAGIERIAILNGGLVAWRAAELPLTTAATAPATSTIDATLSDEWMLDERGVQAVLDGEMNARLVDARPLDFFEGQNKHPAAAEAGTLRGAMRLVHSSWFGESGGVISDSPEAARRIAANAGYDGALEDGETLVSFCNTGHWASTNWFALSEIAGIENVKLYPESMVGWTKHGGEVVKGNGG